MEGPGHHDKENYEPFFGLNEAPFSLAPDPRFLFASASHSAALADVGYALRRREPLVVITGEIGSGKTLLCRTVLQRFERKTFLSVINDPLVDRDELLKQMLQDFGVISKDRTKLVQTSRHELIEALHDFLRTLAPIEAHAVVIIDEAQHLKPDVLEQIRLLSNIDDKQGTLLQIVLVGQPDLDVMLARPELRQLQQRISRRSRLEPLSAEEVHKYIEHRLDFVRGKNPHAGVEFAPDSVRAIAKLSRGLPRVINLLCDRSLEAAYAARLRVVEAEFIDTAARALGLAWVSPPAVSPPVASPPVVSSPAVTTPAATTPVSAAPPVPAAPVPPPLVVPPPLAEPPLREPARDDVPMAFGPPPRRTGPRVSGGVIVAASVALAAVGTWLGLRATRLAAPVAQASPPPQASGGNRQQPPPPATTTPPGPPAVSAPAPAPAARTPAPAAAPTSSTAAAPPAAAVSDRFDIVVASFRTDARATAVAGEVAALGLPTRKRSLEAWTQVVCGPFVSRGDAEDAQERLRKAGLGGTQIVLAAR